MINILVVDDDDSIRKLISTYLSYNGYNIFEAYNGVNALEIMAIEHLDLVILDIMMPLIDGYELTCDIRSINKELPILMISAKDAIEDKKKGFSVGTDDYMTKPIDLEEMLYRIKSLLRRAKISTERKIEIGDVVLNYDTLTFSHNDTHIELRKKEFYLLFKLLSYPDKIFTRRQLMDEIWGMESDADERTVDVHIKRLRSRFQNFEEFEIVTVRGLGYKAQKII
jgi:two-component system, OmpR family, response regulator